MKNFLIIVLLISWSVFSDDETMHEDHKSMESMEMMDHMHHSEHHSSAPVGTAGNGISYALQRTVPVTTPRTSSWVKRLGR